MTEYKCPFCEEPLITQWKTISPQEWACPNEECPLVGKPYLEKHLSRLDELNARLKTPEDEKKIADYDRMMKASVSSFFDDIIIKAGSEYDAMTIIVTALENRIEAKGKLKDLADRYNVLLRTIKFAEAAYTFINIDPNEYMPDWEYEDAATQVAVHDYLKKRGVILDLYSTPKEESDENDR